MNRRELLIIAALLSGGTFARSGVSAPAPGSSRRIGLQLYTLKEEMAVDFAGTLRKVAEAGYEEVEFAGLFGHKPLEVRAMLDAAGLRAVSGHFDLDTLRNELSRIIDEAAALGLRYIVCPDSWVADESRYRPASDAPDDQTAAYYAVLDGMTLDDWRWNADVFNRIGQLTKAAGIQFCYHNHTAEFTRHGDTVAYDELLARTDPTLVAMELDCAWMTAAGFSPSDYLQRHPGRFPLLHVKDIVAVPAPGAARSARTTEVGRGIIDWKTVFAAARATGVQHYFVEQEAPFTRPPIEAVSSSRRYLRDIAL